MEVYLETERLILRRFTLDDVEHLVELDSDPEVMRYLTGGRPTPREMISNETLPRLLGDYQRGDGFGRWAAIEKATGAFIGWVGFRSAGGAPPGEAELGYRLRRVFWGKGYATEGSRALIRKGFTELGVWCVVANTMTVNRASRRVMEKVGMSLTRTYFLDWPERIEGAELGDVEYALLKEDWERRK
jgi:RimJ/RimL family protein N-acetyltransferase